MYLYRFFSAHNVETGAPQEVLFFFPPDKPYIDPITGSEVLFFASSVYAGFGKGKTWSFFTAIGSRFITERLKRLKWEPVPTLKVPDDLRGHAAIFNIERRDRREGRWFVANVPESFVGEMEDLSQEAPRLSMERLDRCLSRGLFFFAMFGGAVAIIIYAGLVQLGLAERPHWPSWWPF